MPIKLPSFRPRRDAYPPDLWTKCPSCGEMLFNKQLDKVLRVCPSCGHHFRLSAEARLELLLDHGSFAERDARPRVRGPARVRRPEDLPGPGRGRPARDRACATPPSGARARSTGRPVAICVMDFGFMGGSMGAVVGEKVTRAAEHALAERGAADRRLGIRRRADAGGHALAHAAREDRRRARAAARRRRPVPQHPQRPDDRRRVRLVRGPRRRQHRRAERADRVRRRARLGRHDRPGAAAGLPALGVPVRARLPRPGRPSLASSATRSSRLLRYLRRPRHVVADEARSACRPSGRSRSCRTSPSVCRPSRVAAARRPRRCRRSLRPVAAAAADASTDAPTSRPPTSRRHAGRGHGGVARVTADRAAATARTDGDRPERRRLGARPARPQPRAGPRTLDLLAAIADEFIELHGDRLFGDDDAIVAGLARIGDRRVVVDRPAEGRRHRREHPAQLRHAPPRGLSQGDAGHGARRAVRPARS